MGDKMLTRDSTLEELAAILTGHADNIEDRYTRAKYDHLAAVVLYINKRQLEGVATGRQFNTVGDLLDYSDEARISFRDTTLPLGSKVIDLLYVFFSEKGIKPADIKINRETTIDELLDALKRKKSIVDDVKLKNSYTAAMADILSYRSRFMGEGPYPSARKFATVGDLLDYSYEIKKKFGINKTSTQLLFTFFAEMGLTPVPAQLNPESGFADVMKFLNASGEETSAVRNDTLTNLIVALGNNGKLPKGYETVGAIINSPKTAEVAFKGVGGMGIMMAEMIVSMLQGAVQSQRRAR